jgi:RTX calcium-binding nonapeptide repeat (4 copies)
MARWAPAVLLALVLAIGFPAPSTTGASPREMVLYGAEGGSRLELKVRGGNILARGLMGAAPSGCHFTVAHIAASCPTAGADQIEVDMGPEGDEVDVVDPLPVPLTVHLGGGSDRFIGNDENDTCYSEGAMRNRCIGGGGNDICITGNSNSDCVGGPGNDLCVHGAGSDGCWGGPGNDVCRMGAGDDGCHGGPGDDRLYGGPGADQLYGGPGDDYCDGGPGVGRSHECEAGPGH